MLVNISAMRQSVAITLFVFSLEYLHRKDAIRYFLCIGLASLFHISALFLLALYPLGLFNWRINKLVGVIILLIFVSLFFLGPLVAPQIEQVVDLFEKYTARHEKAEISTGLGVIFYFGMLILILYFERMQNRGTALMFKIAVIGSLLLPFNLIMN